MPILEKENMKTVVVSMTGRKALVCTEGAGSGYYVVSGECPSVEDACFLGTRLSDTRVLDKYVILRVSDKVWWLVALVASGPTVSSYSPLVKVTSLSTAVRFLGAME